MKQSVVQYKGHNIHTGSHAYELRAACKYKELDAHLARLRREAIDRGEFTK